MSRNIFAVNISWIVLAFGASLAPANGQPYRQPLGVYAHLDIDKAIKYASQHIPNFSNLAPPQQHIALQQLYAGLLSDPAISGITAGQHWDEIELSSPLCTVENNCAPNTENGFDWSYLDDVFIAANGANKSVKLIITPGVDTPAWVLAQIPSCNGMFLSATDASGYAPSDCGKVAFTGFPEQSHGSGDVLPLPWNSTYIFAWEVFLGILEGHYYSNPAFVAIAVAGPTCGSTEMILPTTLNGATEKSKGMPADMAWMNLIAHSFPGVSKYQNSDQVFIDQWKQTIDMYEKIFRGITLIVSPDSGDDLPALPTTMPTDTLFTNLYKYDCLPASPTPSCLAKVEILAHFINVSGPNAKATQVGGMAAASRTASGNIGIPGVKELTITTKQLPLPSPLLLGGAQFDHSVQAPTTVEEGCLKPNVPKKGQGCPGLTVEEAAYNVFTVFFYGTTASAYSTGLLDVTPGPALMQYVEINFGDVIYAHQNPCPPTPVAAIGNQSLEDLINDTSFLLFKMAGDPALVPFRTCATVF